MKLTFFLVVLGLCYCVSYESFDVGPGSLEVASMADHNYGDMGQIQLERDYIFDSLNPAKFDTGQRNKCSGGGRTGSCSIVISRNNADTGRSTFDPSTNLISEMRKRKTKGRSKLCSEETGGCFFILARSLRSDPKLVIAPPLMPNEMSDPIASKIQEEAKSSCPEEMGGCYSTSIARFIRSGKQSGLEKQKNLRQTQKTPPNKPLRKMGNVRCDEKLGGCSFTLIRSRSGNPFSTVKKNMDSSPDYVNLDDKYSNNDYQS